MKIVFVCDTLGSGGAERVISTLTNEFIKLGHDVDVVMLSKEADKPFYELDKKVDLTYLLKDTKKDLGFSKKAKLLKKVIISKNPDVVISFLSYVCIYTWWALRKTKIPYVVSERNDPHSRGRIKQLLLNKSFKKACGCVFQTYDALEWYSKITGDKSIVIYNPVKLSYEPEGVARQKKQILYVGRFNEQKNLFMLIDAFKLFSEKHSDYILKMYGDGPLKEPISNYIKDNQLSDRIVLLESSKSWQKEEFDSALFVLPSKFEGMPNVLAEALCLGIPSISTDCPIGGPKELKKLFPNTLSLTADMSPETFAKNMEEGITLNNIQSKIPDELNTQFIAKKWLDFINKTCKKR